MGRDDNNNYITERNRRATIMKNALKMIAYGDPYDGARLSKKQMRGEAETALYRVEESHRIEEEAHKLIASERCELCGYKHTTSRCPMAEEE